MLDLDGNPVIMPHKRSWNNPHFIGDPSNPMYQQGHIDYYRKYLDYGASTLQRDEVESIAFAAASYGGGFSETGVTGFSEWLAANVDRRDLRDLGIRAPLEFRYDDYLRERGAPVGDAFAGYDDPLKPYWERYWREESTRFFKTVIEEVKSATDRPITFSCNNTSLQIWEYAHLEFDFAISELLLGSANPNHIWERSVAARENGKFQVFGSPKTRGTEVDPQRKKDLTRKVIATAYASGSASRVPWDIFQQTPDGGGRYFGEPSDYADLYAFVRAQDWSGYDEIRAFGPDVDTLAIDDDLMEIEGTEGVYGFIQQNDDPDRPPLLHLVNWGVPTVLPPSESKMSFLEESRTGTRIYFSRDGEENLNRTDSKPIILRLSRDFADGAFNGALELLTPVPFDAELHREVVVSGDFERFVEVTRLPGKAVLGRFHEFQIPALGPWGILRPAKD